jgi:EAL domain-containing protein (putative c-di-GMP-specific phosphodiesterase class I)
VDGLIGGLERHELDLLFQPEISCLDERLIGVESLVRWDGEQSGDATLDQLFQDVERAGEIDRLGDWVLRRACRNAASWSDVFVAVNVSPLQFRRGDFVDSVFAAAAAAGLPLSRLELEITEHACFDDLGQAAEDLQRLRETGVKIALDDFGAGRSPLTHLRRLPLDRLKIDKSFVADLAASKTVEIVKAIVALAKALDLEVTAEGVETRAQFEFLRAAGCDCVQGFLFSGPLSAAGVAERIERAAAG